LGYTNEEFGIYEDLPAIVFDDFTTDSKYVDFGFKVRSSAIKILKARSADVNLRFVYERMRLLRFPLGEHKRYYISEYQHIGLPTPEPGEQAAIAAVLSDMDAEITALEQRRDKTHALEQAMMQELLTGRTRSVASRK
jgi:type I restriction enzyme S subunit